MLGLLTNLGGVSMEIVAAPGKNSLKSVPLSASLNFTDNLIRLMRTYGVCTLPSNFFTEF